MTELDEQRSATEPLAGKPFRVERPKGRATEISAKVIGVSPTTILAVPFSLDRV